MLKTFSLALASLAPALCGGAHAQDSREGIRIIDSALQGAQEVIRRADYGEAARLLARAHEQLAADDSAPADPALIDKWTLLLEWWLECVDTAAGSMAERDVLHRLEEIGRMGEQVSTIPSLERFDLAGRFRLHRLDALARLGEDPARREELVRQGLEWMLSPSPSPATGGVWSEIDRRELRVGLSSHGMDPERTLGEVEGLIETCLDALESGFVDRERVLDLLVEETLRADRIAGRVGRDERNERNIREVEGALRTTVPVPFAHLVSMRLGYLEQCGASLDAVELDSRAREALEWIASYESTASDAGIAERGWAFRQRVAARHWIAEAHRRRGELGLAREEYLAVQRECDLEGDDPLRSIKQACERTTRDRLGILAFELGDFDAALVHFGRDARPETAFNVAACLRALDRLDEARDHVEDVLRNLRGGKDPLLTAQAEDLAGLILEDLAHRAVRGGGREDEDRLAAAYEHYARAGELYRAIDHAYGIARHGNLLAERAVREGRLEEAEEMLAGVLSRAKREGWSDLVYDSHYDLARIALRRSRAEAAIEHCREGAAVLERELDVERLLDEGVGWLQDAYDVDLFVTWIQALVARREESLAWSAVEPAERARGRGLLELVTRDDSRSDATLTRKRREIGREISDLQTRLFETADEETALPLRRELLARRAELTRLERESRAGIERPPSRFEPLSIERIREFFRGRGDVVCLAYLLGRVRSYLWVQRGGEARLLELPSIERLRPLVHDYYQSLATPPATLEEAFDERASRALAEHLLPAGIEELLGGARAALIVHDDLLAKIPFDALITTDGRMLAERLALFMAPSLSVFIRLATGDAHPHRGQLWLLGSPDLATNALGKDLEPLRYSEGEVQSIADQFSGEALAFLGAAASESLLKRGDGGSPTILHLSTHGLLDMRVHGGAALLLSAGDGEDGVLWTSDLDDLSVQPDLVVLSACGSGRGVTVRGDGIVGPARAFFAGGARSVVASLWMVNQSSTSELMRRFYEGLEMGRSRLEALHEAKRAVRSQAPHPYFWAGFQLMGADAPGLANGGEESTTLPVLIAIVAASVVLAAAIMLRRARRSSGAAPTSPASDRPPGARRA